MATLGRNRTNRTGTARRRGAGQDLAHVGYEPPDPHARYLEVLAVSERTVRRDWEKARLLLASMLE